MDRIQLGCLLQSPTNRFFVCGSSGELSGFEPGGSFAELLVHPSCQATESATANASATANSDLEGPDWATGVPYPKKEGSREYQ